MRLTIWLAALAAPACAGTVDLTRAAVVVVARDGGIAAVVLVEELEKRSGIRLPVAPQRPAGGTVIEIAPGAGDLKPEGYRLTIEDRGAGSQVTIRAAGARGALYGVGRLLRQIEWGKGKLNVAAPLDVTEAPQSAIRGHQLGYRATANSWDAWTVAQFDQYIRELALFGINSVENIPYQDERPIPHQKVPRREMNRAMNEICLKYGLDYWVWTPAAVDLNDRERRAKLLESFEELFRDVPELTGVFVPGGDPGDNPPELVLPLLEDIARRMRPRHPKAQVWLSLQRFSAADAEKVYRWLDERELDWFGGIVAGPSSPPVAETRHRLAKRYRLRLYPDITHNKISQFEVPEWDQAYALTLGREAINPRPFEYAAIHNRYAPLSDGFISYSDGVHDDVNKAVWSALGWDRSRAPRDIVIEYARLFFDPAAAEEAADAILALERNWRGSLIANGGVEAALAKWNDLERRMPHLAANWRWQMCLLRANYDAFVRRRLIQDGRLEREANAILAAAARTGAAQAMAAAGEVLNRAVSAPAGAELRHRIAELGERLFQSIGLQTSVPKYHASGAERGAVLDFLDNPLNNRWWLEDEFAKVRALASEAEKVRRLEELARWEDPGPGSFYDDIGNIRNSPRVVKGEGEDSDPLFWWWDQGQSRARLSWQVTLWPRAVVYEGLDPKAAYTVKTTGYGQALLRVDGERVPPSVDGREMHEFKLFPVPARHLGDGQLTLTWDKATDEEHLNWRRRSRLAEVWLLKR
jgi:hypothetical protein